VHSKTGGWSAPNKTMGGATLGNQKELSSKTDKVVVTKKGQTKGQGYGGGRSKMTGKY